MSLASAWAVALQGVDGMLVEIEAHIGPGLPGLHMVGLPDTALSEARDRVRAAVINSGERWPPRRMTLALSPATLPKGGSSYDLALACALLAADRRIPGERLCGLVLIGELALDGRLRPVRGVLPAVLAARGVGIDQVVVPTASLAEASLVEGMRVRGATCLKEVLSWLRNPTVELTCPGLPRPAPPAAVPDLGDVLAQGDARWAVEVAAAGGHHLFLTGPPGTGKTMLAQRMVGLLPALTGQEALEVTAVHSVAGLLSPETPLLTLPPFVAPHHTSSVAALVGGGSGLAKPGAVSRAHRGVLFLDERANLTPRLLYVETSSPSSDTASLPPAVSWSLPWSAVCRPHSHCYAPSRRWRSRRAALANSLLRSSSGTPASRDARSQSLARAMLTRVRTRISRSQRAETTGSSSASHGCPLSACTACATTPTSRRTHFTYNHTRDCLDEICVYKREA
jgi:energy-coupling factor transporter ATP-binding protein EcfA2